VIASVEQLAHVTAHAAVVAPNTSVDNLLIVLFFNTLQQDEKSAAIYLALFVEATHFAGKQEAGSRNLMVEMTAKKRRLFSR